MTLTQILLPRLLLCSSLLFSAAQAQFASTGTVASAASPEHELLLRALTLEDFTQVETLTGRLPSRFPLTLPSGSRLIGSIVTRTTPSGGGMNVSPNVRVFFDHAQSPAELKKVISAALNTAGFQPMPQGRQPGMPNGGFQPTVSLFGDMWYRRQPNQVVYFTLRRVGSVTQVSLTLEESRDLEQRLRFAELGRMGPQINLPQLTPPPGSTVFPQGSGSSGDDVQQTMRIETTLNTTALLNHYAAQLKKAGWTSLNQAQSGNILTSLWRTRESGMGLLTFTELQKGVFKGTLAVFLPR